MKTKLALVGLAMAAGMCLAPMAWADQPEYRGDHREYGDDSNYRSDSRRGREPVRVLASRLEEAAEDLNESAQAGSHHATSRERRALRLLENFQARARHFNRQVRNYPQDRSHTEGDFRALLYSYRQAAESFPALHSYRWIRRDFNKASYLMDQLAEAYSGRRYEDDRYRRNGRYDGRYDDDDD